MRIRDTKWLALAVVLAGAGGVAFAGDLVPSAQSASDLAAAMVPLLHDEGGGGAVERSGAGLRCWLGYEARKPDPFDSFARPVTNLSFHHPFIWNEIRPVFIQHEFPEDSLVGGGNLRAYACQIHAKISDDVQFTAYKDGYVDFNPDATLDEDKGFADLAFGFKYKVWEDLQAPAIFTVGLGWETTTGDEDVLQGGDGDLIDVFGSYARRIGSVNFITTAGFLLPLDTDEAVRTFHWHGHLDVPLSNSVSALFEFNWFRYLSDAEYNAGLGPTVPLGFEAYDYSNLGADDVDGNSVASFGLGFRWFISNDVSLGMAYEWPITDREDLFDSRYTLDFVLRF